MTDEQEQAREALIIAAIAFKGLLQRANDLGVQTLHPNNVTLLMETVESVAALSIDLKPLDEHLTRHQMAVMAEANDGMIEGIVRVDLSDAIDNGLEDTLDLLSEKLTGGELLSEIEYNVVGHEGDCLWIKVKGNANFIFHGGVYFPWNLHQGDECTIDCAAYRIVHGRNRKITIGDIEYCSDALIRLRPDTDGTFLELSPDDIT